MSWVTSSAASRPARAATNRHTSAWVARTKAWAAPGCPARAASSVRVTGSVNPMARSPLPVLTPSHFTCPASVAGTYGRRNFSAGRDDYPVMTAQPVLPCDQARTALSARLDGEAPGVPAGTLARHVDGCAACADWLTRAEQVTRLVRVQPARVPDLTEAILAAVAADRAATARSAARTVPAVRALWPGRQAVQRLLQAAVAAVAAVQLIAVVPVMFGVDAHGHSSHEVGAFAAALGVGFLLAAFQPRLARAYTPVAVALAVCLLATSGLDVGEHRVTVLHEVAGHWGTVIQVVLIVVLGRLNPAPESPGGRSVVGRPRVTA